MGIGVATMIWALRALDNWVGGTEEEKGEGNRGTSSLLHYLDQVSNMREHLALKDC